MARLILFKNCLECPVGKTDSFLMKKDVLCVELGSSINGHKTYRWISDGRIKPEGCPYPSGILVRKCSKCPYVVNDWGKFMCPKIIERSLVEVFNNKFHKDCPLESIDYDYEKRYSRRDKEP